MTKQKAKVTTIRLYPTDFELDVLVCPYTAVDTYKKFELEYHSLDVSRNDAIEEVSKASVSIIICGDKCKHPHHTRFMMHLLTLKDKAVIAHEIVHVLDMLSEKTGLDTSPQSTEWRAYFFEMVFEQLSNPKNYVNYE